MHQHIEHISVFKKSSQQGLPDKDACLVYKIAVLLGGREMVGGQVMQTGKIVHRITELVSKTRLKFSLEGGRGDVFGREELNL